MLYRILVPTRLALIVLVAAASTVFTSSARAQSSCDLGFPLTTGGVPEADLNGDGLTCEFNTIDSVTGVLTTIAVDNVAVIGPSDCPDGFTGRMSMGLRCKAVHPCPPGPERFQKAHIVCT